MDRVLTVSGLLASYRSGQLTPSAMVNEVLARIAKAGDDKVWISRFSDDVLRARARALDERDPNSLPLYGIPVAVKDNIDVAGLDTTAACPAFRYTPDDDAEAVAQLIAAGAIIIGKTNLDQFATGLVGVRSPYGVARNPFNPEYIPGGSSSGSAVAVAAGLVALSLGTDTAGSGRVPAGFNNLVGLKPSLGLISTRGVVPACRSLDCVSVFAATVGDALAALKVMAVYDPADAFARPAPAGFDASLRPPPARFRFAVPRSADRRFFGNDEGARLYGIAIERMRAMGGTMVEIDYGPLAAAAEVLYSPPGVAERTAGLGSFLTEHGQDMLDVTRTIIGRGQQAAAADVHRAREQLRCMRRYAETIFADVDCLLLPTAPRCYRTAEVLADPIALNSALGTYTNFVNQLDLSALAVPVGMQSDGLPFGVTLVGLAHRDADLAAFGDALHRVAKLPLGASKDPLPSASYDVRPAVFPTVDLAVFGAHLAGEPLNHELLTLGGVLVGACKTTPEYALYRLQEDGPARPGLVKLSTGGVSIGGEIWRLPTASFGAFVARVKAPLVVGTVMMADGTGVKGFLCESYALSQASDISEHGDWRRYRAALARSAAAT